MAYVFHVNGIVTGAISSFCLACESFLTCEQEAKDHIIQALHKKKLTEVPYAERFKDEKIRKFTTGYFCEFCNMLLPIATKVNLHIGEDEHKHNKGTLRLKLMGGDVIAFDDVIVHEKAWHGLTEGICSICNAEFDDGDDHKKDKRHSLNLVLKPIKFGADNAIYREIDASAVQCLTCNKLLAPNMMSRHVNEDEHNTKYEQSRLKTNGVSKEPEVNEILKPTKDENKSYKESSKDKTKILDSINIYHSKGININLETDTAFCRRCSIVIQFTCTDIEDHIAKHSAVENKDSEHKYPSQINHSLNRVNINDITSETKDDANKPDGPSKNEDEKTPEGTFNSCDSSSITIDINEESTDEESCDEFARANSITYNQGNAAAFCRICKVQLPSSLRSMKEHVTGAAHKKTAKQPAKPENSFPILKKEQTREFIDSVCTIKGLFYVDTVVNEKYCIPQFNFLLITKINDMKKRCILCEMNLPPYGDLENHIKSDYHLNKFLAVQVITSKPDEFIREIRDGLYHCGYCNVVVDSWGKMSLHLMSLDHKCKRQNGEAQLNSHLPDMRRHEFMKHMEREFLRCLLNC